jgi:2-desacetyl-2-hydroxyethyl bacteriochlorophyllide A dehydrogenase
MTTSSAVRGQRFMFPEKQKVVLENYDVPPVGDDEVRVRLAFTLMSTGTENIVFNRNFEPGSHWDDWVKYPFYPGYTGAGVVEEVGKAVTTLKVGDRVTSRARHSSHAVTKAENCYRIPDALTFEQASWFGLAKITFHGARRTEYQIGDRVMIIGAGPIGQMSIRWAHALGAASIIVVDGMPNRLALAQKGGATTTIAKTIEEAREEILAAGNGVGPRVINDSTGNAAVLSAALRIVANFGRVILLGDTGFPQQQTLTRDVLTRGLTIIGVHDSHNTPEWNEGTVSKLFFNYATSGRFNMEGLTSHVFKPEQCMDAYTTANRDRASTMGILFDWSGR